MSMPLLALSSLVALLLGGTDAAGPALTVEVGADNHRISQYIYGSSLQATYPARSITLFELHSPDPPPPPPPLSLTVASFKAGQHGRVFRTAMTVRRSDTGDLLKDGQLDCSAKFAHTATASTTSLVTTTARCSWQVPKRLRGKRITGSEKVTYAGKSVTRRFSARIK
jgi:hypothetical protein